MAGYNRVILMGNLTRSPELRYTPQGTAVADLGIAVNTPRGRGTERRDDTVFIDVTVWDRQAETCCEYLNKGSAVLVEGRLTMDQWEDRETGARRTKIKVTAQNVQFLNSREGGAPGSSGGDEPRRSSNRPAQSDDGDFDNDFGNGDDIPF